MLLKRYRTPLIKIINLDLESLVCQSKEQASRSYYYFSEDPLQDGDADSGRREGSGIW